MKKRVFLIVMDSVGAGSLPDAHLYGDVGANTLRSISKSERFNIPNLISMGIGNIDGIDFLAKEANPTCSIGRLMEKSAGKDTTTGHWELAGVILDKPFPTYPDGFPQEIIEKFSEKTGKEVLCNRPYSGTQVILDYGQQHIESGKLIVYTSADSVFQIAAHEDIVSRGELYEYCQIARDILSGEHGVGRVIARPFKGDYPDFYRTDGRHDFSLQPPCETLLDYVIKGGQSVISIGKISDIFAGQGISCSYPTKNNADGMEQLLLAADMDFAGLCFANLVDFDMVYGHRNDVDGYAQALSEFDAFLPSLVKKLTEEDMLVITADHGCDPAFKGTDHSREYIPALIYSKKFHSVNFGTRKTYSDIGKTVADYLGVKYKGYGEKIL